VALPPLTLAELLSYEIEVLTEDQGIARVTGNLSDTG
jgi:hypothetical protein